MQYGAYVLRRSTHFEVCDSDSFGSLCMRGSGVLLSIALEFYFDALLATATSRAWRPTVRASPVRFQYHGECYSRDDSAAGGSLES